MRLLSAKLLPVLAAAVIACGETTGPGSIPGTFVLRSVDGKSLPFTRSGPTIDPSHSVLGGTVTLDADGTVTLVERRRFFGQPTDEIVTLVSSYRLDGPRIAIGPGDCPPNTICEPNPNCPSDAVCWSVKGVLINSMLSLDSPFGPDLTYLYHVVTDE